MQVQFRKSTRQILAYGTVLSSTDADIDIAQIAAAEETKLTQPGIKSLAQDGSVTVTPIVPSLADIKTEKRKALLFAFKEEYAQIWLIDGIEVEEQKDSILAKTAANRTANETNLVNQAGTLITKIKLKLSDVNNATTEAQVQAIVW